jgi:hypothetical protein
MHAFSESRSAVRLFWHVTFQETTTAVLSNLQLSATVLICYPQVHVLSGLLCARKLSLPLDRSPMVVRHEFDAGREAGPFPSPPFVGAAFCLLIVLVSFKGYC